MIMKSKRICVNVELGWDLPDRGDRSTPQGAKLPSVVACATAREEAGFRAHMEDALRLLSAVFLVAALGCALVSLALGVRAWTHRWDERMASWQRDARGGAGSPDDDRDDQVARSVSVGSEISSVSGAGRRPSAPK